MATSFRENSALTDKKTPQSAFGETIQFNSKLKPQLLTDITGDSNIICSLFGFSRKALI
jgi:hypothetical protein